MNHTFGIYVDGYSVIYARQYPFDVTLFLNEFSRIMSTGCCSSRQMVHHYTR